MAGGYVGGDRQPATMVTPAGPRLSRQLGDGCGQSRTLVADLDSLPARQSSVLLLRELSGLLVVEIAAAMSMSTSAVKQRLF